MNTTPPHTGLIHLRLSDLREGLYSYGGTTVVYNLYHFGPESFVALTIARCSTKDKFKKLTGRATAVARMNRLEEALIEAAYVPSDDDETAYEIAQQLEWALVIPLKHLVSPKDLKAMTSKQGMRQLIPDATEHLLAAKCFIPEKIYPFGKLFIDTVLNEYVNKVYSYDCGPLTINRRGNVFVVEPSLMGMLEDVEVIEA